MHFGPCHLQLLNQELREAKSAKMEKMKMNVTPNAEASLQQSPAQNHLPQSPPDTPASAQMASSVPPAAPAAHAAGPPPPAKLHLGRDQFQSTRQKLPLFVGLRKKVFSGFGCHLL